MKFCQAVVFAAMLQASLLLAQVAPSAQPSYIASVKRANKAEAPGFWITRGRLLARGVTARYLVAIAYGVQKFQVTGGAGWVDREQFDVESRLQDEKVGSDAEKLMIQLLLKDRFQLIVHQETKESSVYALVAAKNRSKVKPSSASSLGGVNIGAGRLEGTGMQMGLVASLLGTLLGRTVIDRTNLTGLYDVHLNWTPETRRATRSWRGSPAVRSARNIHVRSCSASSRRESGRANAPFSKSYVILRMSSEN